MSDEERRLLEAPVRASDGQGSEVVGPPTAWGDKGERFREELIDYGRALLAAKRVTVRVTRMNASGAVEAIEDREEPVAAQVAGVARAIQSLVAVEAQARAEEIHDQARVAAVGAAVVRDVQVTERAPADVVAAGGPSTTPLTAPPHGS